MTDADTNEANQAPVEVSAQIKDLIDRFGIVTVMSTSTRPGGHLDGLELLKASEEIQNDLAELLET